MESKHRKSDDFVKRFDEAAQKLDEAVQKFREALQRVNEQNKKHNYLCSKEYTVQRKQIIEEMPARKQMTIMALKHLGHNTILKLHTFLRSCRTNRWFFAWTAIIRHLVSPPFG